MLCKCLYVFTCSHVHTCLLYGCYRSNININDVLGDYSLALVDSLDTLVVLGNHSEFKRVVQVVIDKVKFDSCATVQVFEATIR